MTLQGLPGDHELMGAYSLCNVPWTSCVIIDAVVIVLLCAANEIRQDVADGANDHQVGDLHSAGPLGCFAKVSFRSQGYLLGGSESGVKP